MKKSKNIQLLGGAGVALVALYLGSGNAQKCRYEYYRSYSDCLAKNTPSNCIPTNDQQWSAYKCPSRGGYYGGAGRYGSGWFSKRGGFGSSGRGFSFGG